VDLERGPLSFVSTIEELLGTKSLLLAVAWYRLPTAHIPFPLDC
jgi:hypothetical protein